MVEEILLSMTKSTNASFITIFLYGVFNETTMEIDDGQLNQ